MKVYHTYTVKWEDGITCKITATSKKEAYNYIYHSYGDKIKFQLIKYKKDT